MKVKNFLVKVEPQSTPHLPLEKNRILKTFVFSQLKMNKFCFCLVSCLRCCGVLRSAEKED